MKSVPPPDLTSDLLRGVRTAQLDAFDDYLDELRAEIGPDAITFTTLKNGRVRGRLQPLDAERPRQVLADTLIEAQQQIAAVILEILSARQLGISVATFRSTSRRTNPAVTANWRDAYAHLDSADHASAGIVELHYPPRQKPVTTRAVAGQISVDTDTYTWKRADGSTGSGTRWMASATVDGKRVRLSSRKSKTDAVSRVQNVIESNARGLYQPSADGRLKAQHIFDQWLAAKRTAGRKPRTLKRNQELVDIHLGPGLGHLTIKQLQDAAIVQRFFDERKAWRDERGRGLSARTVGAIYDALRGAINLAIKRGLMVRSPVGKSGTVEIPRARRKVHVPLAFSEAQALLATADALQHRHANLYRLLLATGVRLGEALAIRTTPGPDTSWADLERGVLHIRQTLEPLTEREALARGFPSGVRWHLDDLKGEHHRDVPRWRNIPLTADAIAALRAQQLLGKQHRFKAGAAWGDHDFLFADELGTPFTQSNINHAIKVVGMRAGVLRIHAHLLRRTAATYLHSKGVPLATIQAILGHSTIGVTMGYIDATALDALDAAKAAMASAFDDIRASAGA